MRPTLAISMLLGLGALTVCAHQPDTESRGGTSESRVTLAIPDSIAHPIVSACGARIDPASYLDDVSRDAALAPEERRALERIESELRVANEPLGEAWHGAALDDEGRGAILRALRANYQAWWEDVQDVLGRERARALLFPPSPDPGSLSTGREGETRCLRHSLPRILSLQ